MDYPYLSETVVVKKGTETDTTGEFSIEGLYPGYGVTVGNALRRTLLSSLPGAAISQVKIKGVKHEFSTITGVAENVMDIALNLKQVRFIFHADEPQTLYLKVKGKRNVTAGDIEQNPLVEVVNKDLYLAEITDSKTELTMELVVEKGLGYLSAEERQAERLPVGTILLDCIFSPVVNVEMEVENMRVGEHTNYNKLRLIVTTDGSITPSRAMRQAGNIMRDHFAKVADAFAPAESAEETAAESEEKPKAKKPAAKKPAAKKSTKKK